MGKSWFYDFYVGLYGKMMDLNDGLNEPSMKKWSETLAILGYKL